MDEFFKKAIAFAVYKYRIEHGITEDEMWDWRIAEHFWNCYSEYYRSYGNDFLRAYLKTKFED